MVFYDTYYNKRKKEFFTAIQETFSQLSVKSLDVTLVCKDDHRIGTHKRLLGMASPLLREILGPPHTPDSSIVILPSFSQVFKCGECGQDVNSSGYVI